MTQFVVEDIPVESCLQGSERAQYPFHTLNVGQSFLVPKDLVKRVRSASNQFGRRHGKRFSVRVDPADGSARCGRIA